ncbi:MAG: DUF1016 family protein [Saprospiraceae bacterium]|nr:DUF1016 family protein [Saprospiraceae bacterium]
MELSKALQNQFLEIAELIRKSRAKVLSVANEGMIDLYWRVGQSISGRTEQDGWGKSTVKQLAIFIAADTSAPRGFSDKNLWRMKQFYEAYKDKPELRRLSGKVSWTHNLLIFSKTKSDEERVFYYLLTMRERFSKRELERSIDSGYFERTLLANPKLSPAVRVLLRDSTDVFKDTYIWEFLHLPEPFSEKDLRKALLANLKKFILELGADFVFIGEEYRVQVGNKDFFIDLLFFHRELCCLVPFELKVEEFKPEFMGKLNFYLEALDRDVRKPHENPSMGVLLCKSKDDEIVEYAMSRNISPLLVADYQTKLLDKDKLRRKLHEIFSPPDLLGEGGG